MDHQVSKSLKTQITKERVALLSSEVAFGPGGRTRVEYQADAMSRVKTKPSEIARRIGTLRRQRSRVRGKRRPSRRIQGVARTQMMATGSWSAKHLPHGIGRPPSVELRRTCTDMRRPYPAPTSRISFQGVRGVLSTVGIGQRCQPVEGTGRRRATRPSDDTPTGDFARRWLTPALTFRYMFGIV